jgi:hypothetical protein
MDVRLNSTNAENSRLRINAATLAGLMYRKKKGAFPRPSRLAWAASRGDAHPNPAQRCTADQVTFPLRKGIGKRPEDRELSRPQPLSW